MSPEETSSDQAPHRFQKRGFSYERVIKYFFASNAGLTIVILSLIIIFLLKEGLGFFPGYQRELQVYRIAGLEFVDISRRNLTAHEQLTSVLNRAYYAEINAKHPAQRYFDDSDSQFTLLGLIPAKFNRLVVYRGSLLHSACVNPALSLNANPRAGRLTVNSFYDF